MEEIKTDEPGPQRLSAHGYVGLLLKPPQFEGNFKIDKIDTKIPVYLLTKYQLKESLIRCAGGERS